MLILIDIQIFFAVYFTPFIVIRDRLNTGESLRERGGGARGEEIESVPT